MPQSMCSPPLKWSKKSMIGDFIFTFKHYSFELSVWHHLKYFTITCVVISCSWVFSLAYINCAKRYKHVNSITDNHYDYGIFIFFTYVLIIQANYWQYGLWKLWDRLLWAKGGYRSYINTAQKNYTNFLCTFEISWAGYWM